MEYKKILLQKGLKKLNDYQFRAVKCLLESEVGMTKTMRDNCDRIEMTDLMFTKFPGPECVDKLIDAIRDDPDLKDLVDSLRKEKHNAARKRKAAEEKAKRNQQQDGAGPSTPRGCPSFPGAPGGAAKATMSQKRKIYEKVKSGMKYAAQQSGKRPCPVGTSPSRTQVGMESFSPATVSFQPATTSFQPADPSFQPATTNLQPATTNLQPVTTNLQTATTNLQPATTNLQTATTNFQPATTSFEPATTRFQPTTKTFSPANTSFQQATTSFSPVTMNFPLATTSFQPATTSFQPATTNLKLATTNLQPATTNLQPATTNLQTATTNLQTATTNFQPATTSFQPATKSFSPANTSFQQATTSFSPVTMNFPPATTSFQPATPSYQTATVTIKNDTPSIPPTTPSSGSTVSSTTSTKRTSAAAMGAADKRGPTLGPRTVMVLERSDLFVSESKEQDKPSMFHATVVTPTKFFRVKVLDAALWELFAENNVLTISGYSELRGIMEVRESSSVSPATSKIHVPNSIIKRARETPKIDDILKFMPGTSVYGQLKLSKKTVNKKNTIYELEDSTGSIDMVGSGQWHELPCERGDKLKLFCLRLRTIKQNPTLTCEEHSLIQLPG